MAVYAVTMRKNHKGRKRKKRNKSLRLRTKREAQVLEKVLAAMSLSRREKLDLRLAAKIEGTRVSTIRRYAPSAIEKRNGTYRVKPFDRIPRVLNVAGSKGMRPLALPGSRPASMVSHYMIAVRALIYKNDPSGLARFRGKKIAGYRFVTNVALLKRLADAGLLGFERLYASVTHGR